MSGEAILLALEILSTPVSSDTNPGLSDAGESVSGVSGSPREL